MTHFEEDIALGSTYTAGGTTATVVQARSISLIDYCYLKATSGTGTTTYPVAMAVVGSESGQTFKFRLFQVPGSSSGVQNLVEVASMSAGMTLHVSYEGT